MLVQESKCAYTWTGSRRDNAIDYSWSQAVGEALFWREEGKSTGSVSHGTDDLQPKVNKIR